MAGINNAEALRAWLRSCPAIPRESPFGADYLGDEAGGWALCAAPTKASARENILGEAALSRRQEREYWLDARLPYSGDAARNLENLGILQAVEAWVLAQNAAGAFPQWEGGRVTAILPTVSAAPKEFGADAARYRMKLRVEFEAAN